MRLVCLVLVCLLVNCLGKEEESNEISTSQQPKINLDSNFRRALLKALTELENEASKEDQSPEDLGEKIVEKASASAVSLYTNEDDDETVSSTVKNQILSSTTTTTEKAYVLVQKSDGITHKPITTIEHDDPILVSESNSFQPPKKYNKLETTTEITTTTSTEESEAKVEDVQFFSAPLVAAFTVHQDETGVPKKVEPIYKVKKETERKENLLLAQEQARKQQQQQLVFEQDRFVLQQKRLEQEIAFLKQQQQRQEQLLKQHQLKEKLLQEQIRIRSNEEPFKPMIKAKPKEKDAMSVALLQPSISFNPIVEAGRLPTNGQLLPIKNAIDFRSPFIQTPTFQQFHSVPHTSNTPPLLTAFEAFSGRPQLDLVPPQSNRILRQETNVGNFGFSPPNSNTFSIQPSIQSQSFSSFDSSLLPEQNRFFRSNFEQPNRFFRTNFEQSNRFNQQRFPPPQANNYYLNNLLYNSGAVHGKPSEDFNIITKVLSLNHLGSDNRYAASSKNVEVRVPFYK